MQPIVPAGLPHLQLRLKELLEEVQVLLVLKRSDQLYTWKIPWVLLLELIKSMLFHEDICFLPYASNFLAATYFQGVLTLALLVFNLINLGKITFPNSPNDLKVTLKGECLLILTQFCVPINVAL